MRRADPPPSEPETTTTLSDVSSSPRSVGAGGRSGSMSEEQQQHHQHHHHSAAAAAAWDDAAFSRVKLMCSFGGRILPRPHDNQLRYIGGETRIVVVSRAISFADLAAKLSRTFGSPMVVKYQLPYEDLDALISVTSDEDLENMMEEYDRLQAPGHRSSRLRLFLFPAKLERSQTSSLSDLLGSSQNREQWFLDALNNSPLLPRLRSDASSIFSEPPDFLRSNAVDSLEEWAAAASYGNSSSQHHPPSDDINHQPHHRGSDSVSASLFGSLLQRSISGEVFSAPGSPSLLKSKSSLTGSFSSTSSSPAAAITSILSAVKDSVFKEAPVTQQAGPDIDGNLIAAVLRSSGGVSNLGFSGGGSVEQEQKEHLLSSDMGISIGTTEALQEEDVQKQQRVSTNSERNVIFGRVQLQESSTVQGLTAPPAAVGANKGALKKAISPLLGHPIFDEDDNDANLPLVMSENHVEERDFIPPSMLGTASQQQMPSVVASDMKPRHQGTPLSVFGIKSGFQVEAVPSSAYVLSQSDASLKPDSSERIVQQVLPPPHGLVVKSASEEMSVENIVPLSSEQRVPTVVQGVTSNLDADEFTAAASAITNTNEDRFPQQQISPVLRPATPVVGRPSALKREEDVLSTTNKDALETNQLLQPFTGIPSSVASSTSVQSVTQKPVVMPVAQQFYQLQAQKQVMEERIPAVTYVDQMPVMMHQVTEPTTTPPLIAPLRAVKVPPIANVSSAAALRSQSPPRSTHAVAAAQQQALPQPTSRVKTTSPPLSSLPGEALKVVTNVNSFSAVGEPMTSVLPAVQQVEIPNLSRQTSDQLSGQRMAWPNRSPHQFAAPAASIPAASGLSSQLRVVGSPVVQMAEGVPQLYEKKLAAPLQRVTPSTRVVPAAPNSYYVVRHPDAPATGIPFYTATSNVMIAVSGNSSEAVPYTGANPFVDDFSSQIPSYQAVSEVIPQDQLQRQPTPALMKAKVHQIQK